MQYKLLPTAKMKYIKFCSIVIMIASLTTIGSNETIPCFSDTIPTVNKPDNKTLIYTTDKNAYTQIKNEIPINKPLSEGDLKYLFPDANFRNVIIRNFKNQEITLDKIADLSGEFYATGENIESLEGISYLKSIEDFIFWNNNIKTIPAEILRLKNIKSINLANNYITNGDIINKLIDKKVDVNCDLNFIKNKSNQYNLSSYYKTLTLNTGEEISIDKLLYKNIKSYHNYWEPTKEISKNIKYMISIDDSKIITLEENFKLKAASKGNCRVKISLDDNFYKKSTVTINIKVKD
ncbi:MAG: hypothetical protein ACI3VR_13050 [Intestinibacter sp.]|uniref:hypothetical protein n=1 Tax=Intestinibacter sp. TaxID=1965304 RepID=UPI003F175EEE